MIADKLIKDHIVSILDIKLTKLTADQFVRNWNMAGEVLEYLAKKDIVVEISQAYDKTYNVNATQWSQYDPEDGQVVDNYAHANGSLIPKLIMEIAIKLSNT